MSLPEFKVESANPIKARLARNSRDDLANKARICRWILIVVGTFWTASGIYYVVKAETFVDRLLAKSFGRGSDPTVVAERRAEAIRKTKIMNSAGAAMGLVIAILGFVAPRAPVASTLAAFVLFVAVMGGIGLIQFQSISHGILWKGAALILLIVAIAQAQALRKASQVLPDAV